MGAVTFTKANPAVLPMTGGHATPVIDNKRGVRGTITFSASYATGGDTLALTSVGLTEVTGLLVDATNQSGANGAGLSVGLGGTKNAPKIIAVDANNTEVPNATNLSARSAIPVILLGS